MTNKIPYYLSMFTIFTTFILLMYFYVLLFWPIKVIDVKEARVVNGPVEAGSYMQVAFDYCKYNDLTGTVDVELSNGLIQVLPTFRGHVPVGCRETVLNNILIPPDIKPSKYKAHFTLTYQVNPIRHESIHFETPEFEVVKKPPIEEVIKEVLDK